MSTLEKKMLALLASTTIEGEAMAAWRKLRDRKPEGDLFAPGGKVQSRASAASSTDLVEAFQRGLTTGIQQGRREGYRAGFREARTHEKTFEDVVKAHLENVESAEIEARVAKALAVEALWRKLLRALLDGLIWCLKKASEVFVFWLKIYIIFWCLNHVLTALIELLT
ncbi:MAG: hypothetical protein AAFY12_12335 [Pseudomonadota bacterium]